MQLIVSCIIRLFPFLALASLAPLMAAPQEPWRALRQQIRDTSGFRLGTPTQIQVLGDEQTLIFLRALPPSKALELFTLDIKSGREEKLLDAAKLTSSGTVSAEEKAQRERLRLQTTGINTVIPSPSGDRLLIPLNGRLFVYTRKSASVKEIAKGSAPLFNPKLSPDGQWVAYVRNSNVFVSRVDSGIERALTQGGTPEKSYGVAEFVAQEELDRQDGMWWSPDSKTLLIEEVDQSKVERLVISDPAQPNAEPDRPYYPRPGRKNASIRFGFVSILGGSPRWIHFGRQVFEYVAGVNWEQPMPTLQLLDREQKVGTLVQADPLALKVKVLLEERDAAWVDMEVSLPRWLPGGQSFIWSSDRGGARVLELRDADGHLMRTLSPSTLGYQKFISLEPKGQFALVQASARPESSAIYRIDLDKGGAQTVQDIAEGQVQIAFANDKSNFYATRESYLNGGETANVRSYRDKQVRPIAFKTPELVQRAQVTLETVGRDQVRVAIVRPQTFDPTRKYPIVENAYGGPGSQMVRSAGRAYLSDQVLADALDAIVVRMDTRGTPNRGRDWERAIYEKFGFMPVEDHAATLRELVKLHPEMDGDRIGVFGWSYGGYFAAYAALELPEVYKVAVAGAPPVDWLDYDTAYTERYLGLPDKNKDAYDRASLLNRVKPDKAGVKSPILILHGSADDNVYFFHSLKLVDALERGAYPYQFMPLIGMTHMVADPVLEERRFMRSLDFLRVYLARAGTY